MTVIPQMEDLVERKQAMRRQAYDARNAQLHKDELSELAVRRFVELPEYQAARTAMWYVDCRSELRTRHALPAATSSTSVGQYAQVNAAARPAPISSIRVRGCMRCAVSNDCDYSNA